MTIAGEIIFALLAASGAVVGLAEAHTAGIGSAPCRSVAAEDIRDLQRRARHKSRALAGRLSLFEPARDMLQRAHDLADRLGGYSRIQRRGVELGA